MPGVVKVVRDGRYLAVVAEQDFRRSAPERAASGGQMDMGPTFRPIRTRRSLLKTTPSQTDIIIDGHFGTPENDRGQLFAPYFMHASIGRPARRIAAGQQACRLVAHTGCFSGPRRDRRIAWHAKDDVSRDHAEGAGMLRHMAPMTQQPMPRSSPARCPAGPVRVQWMRVKNIPGSPTAPHEPRRARCVDESGAIVPGTIISGARPTTIGPVAPAPTIAGWLVEKPFTPPKRIFAPSRREPPIGNAVPHVQTAGEKVTSHFIAAPCAARFRIARPRRLHERVFNRKASWTSSRCWAGADPVAFD